MPPSAEALSIQDLYAALAASQQRNDLICADLLEIVGQGRTPLLLTERREHVQHFARRLEGLVEVQRRTEERVDALTQQVGTLTQQVGTLAQQVSSLVEAQHRTEERVEALAEAQQRTEERTTRMADALAELAEAQRKSATRLDAAWGALLELRYERRAPSYFAPLGHRLHVLPKEELQDLLEPALGGGSLSAEEYGELMLADIVVRGRRRESDEELYLVVEVSAGIGVTDVERAVKRARLLGKLGFVAVPVVAGERMTLEAEEPARTYGVWRVTDGRAVPPG